jgi:FixJ family two-component response regulator
MKCRDHTTALRSKTPSECCPPLRHRPRAWAGAVEFLSKPFRGQELLDAIRLAIEQNRVWRQEAAVIASLQRYYESLTAREREVMALVVAGRLNKQIAADLEVGEVTVKVHRGQVMRKMQVRSLAKLVRVADKLGIVVPKQGQG